jgi:mRNA-degrading endonuclease RelE of RelBE toxin-antitoxin system
MKLFLTNRFKREYRKAPDDVKDRIDKALRYLASDLKHPSLRAKIIDETNRIWQARVTRNWRIYFQIEDGLIIGLRIFAHKD